MYKSSVIKDIELENRLNDNFLNYMNKSMDRIQIVMDNGKAKDKLETEYTNLMGKLTNIKIDLIKKYIKIYYEE